MRAVAARKRVTATAVARHLGLSQQALSRRWTGQLSFDVDELYRVAEFLGVTVTDLLPPPDQRTQPPPPKVTQPKVRTLTHAARKTTLTGRQSSVQVTMPDAA